MSSQIVDGVWHYNVHVVKRLFTAIRISPTCTGNQSQQYQNTYKCLFVSWISLVHPINLRVNQQIAETALQLNILLPNVGSVVMDSYVLFLELLIYINSEDRSNWFWRAADNDNQTETRVTIEKTGDTSVLAVFDSGE